MNKLKALLLFILIAKSLFAQYPGSVGTIGSTAIFKDSSIFVNWATACTVQRGYQNIADTTLGYTSVGDSTMATGIAGNTGVISLGDGGIATLSFLNPITNEVGFDFAVFENSFSDEFLELAFVEVSSDGVNFFRFPATSNLQIDNQIGPFDLLGDATKLNNLAGKYRAFYGTPFDLQEMDAIPGLDINHIIKVKIIDVVGNIQSPYATFDSNNRPINDPYPTPFASGGFDLDAVGVIHEQPTGLFANIKTQIMNVFPNPINSGQSLTIVSQKKINKLILLDLAGHEIYAENSNIISTNNVAAGIYFLQIFTNENLEIKKIIVR
jgi:hypothetical protein